MSDNTGLDSLFLHEFRKKKVNFGKVEKNDVISGEM